MTAAAPTKIPIQAAVSSVAPKLATTVPTVVPRAVPTAIMTVANILPIAETESVATVATTARQANTPANPIKSMFHHPFY